MAFICSIASSEIANPNSFSAMARFSHSFRHVWKRFCIVSGSDSTLLRCYAMAEE